MNLPVQLVLEIRYGSVIAHVVDSSNDQTLQSYEAPYAGEIWERPARLLEPDLLRSAIAEALAELEGPLPREAVLAVEPVVGVSYTEGGAQALQQVHDDLAEVDEVHTATLQLPGGGGKAQRVYGYDAGVTYAAAEELLRRRIEIAAVVPHEIAALRVAFPDPEGLKKAACFYLTGPTGHIIYGDPEGQPHFGMTVLPPDDAGAAGLLHQTLLSLIAAAAPMVTGSSFGTGSPPERHCCYPEDRTGLPAALQQQLNATVEVRELDYAAGALWGDLYPIDLTPPALRPASGGALASLATLLFLLALAAMAFFTLTLEGRIAATQRYIEARQAEYRLLEPQVRAYNEARRAIERVRRALEALGEAEAAAKPWHRVLPALTDALFENDRPLATLESLGVQEEGGRYRFALGGSTDPKRMLRLLEVLDQSPFELTFKSTRTQGERTRFTLGVGYVPDAEPAPPPLAVPGEGGDRP